MDYLFANNVHNDKLTVYIFYDSKSNTTFTFTCNRIADLRLIYHLVWTTTNDYRAERLSQTAPHNINITIITAVNCFAYIYPKF